MFLLSKMMRTPLNTIIASKRRRFKRAKKSKKFRDWERFVAHKKATASALKAARWDHLNGILRTSLEEKNTKPFYRYIKAQKNDNLTD